MKQLYLFFLIIVSLTACTQNGQNKTGSIHPVNEELKQEAKNIFKDKLEYEESYHSFSSNEVFYQIKSENLTMEQFIFYKNQIIEKNGWTYFDKVGQSYIFCQRTRQLEVIPPQVLVGNKILAEGNIGMQLIDNWNIIFSHTVNGTLNECYKSNR